MTSSVDAEPFFRIVIKAALAPSTRTMLICGGRAEMRIGDVVDEYGRAVDDADGQIIEFVETVRRPIEIDDIFEVADLLCADRRHDVLPSDRVDDVLRRKSVGLQFILVDIHLDLKELASIGRGDRRTGDGGELRPNEVLAIVVDLRLRERFARQRELDDRYA